MGESNGEKPTKKYAKPMPQLHDQFILRALRLVFRKYYARVPARDDFQRPYVALVKTTKASNPVPRSNKT